MGNCFSLLIFLFFSTLHADQLNLVLGSYTLRLNNLLALLLLLCWLVYQRKKIFTIHPGLALSLLITFLSLTLSLGCSPYKARCFFHFGWFGFTLLCYLLLPYFLIKEKGGEKIFSLYLLSFVAVGLYALFQFLLSLFGIHDPFASQTLFGRAVRPNAFCFEPSYYALYMTPFVIFVNGYYFTASKKLPLWQLLGVNFFYLLSTSAALLFSYLALFSLVWFFKSVKRQRVVRFASAALGIAFLFSCLFPAFSKAFLLRFIYQDLMAHHSFFERWIGIENGWKIFLAHPFIGVGFGGYPLYLIDAFLSNDGSFSYLASSLNLADSANPLKLFEATNVTTELLASLGCLGIIAAFSFAYSLWTRYKMIPPEKKALADALMLSCLVTIIVLQFNQGLMRSYIWVHYGIVFGYFERFSFTEMPQFEDSKRIGSVHSVG